MEDRSTDRTVSLKMKVRYDDWSSFSDFCTEYGHGLPEDVCRKTVEEMIGTGTFDSLDHSPEEHTKRSATYWLVLRRLWVYQLAVIGTFAISFFLMRIIPFDAGRIPLAPLYLVVVAGFLSLIGKGLSETFENNRSNGGIARFVRYVRLIELAWLLPLGLLAVSSLFTLGWLAYVTLIK